MKRLSYNRTHGAWCLKVNITVHHVTENKLGDARIAYKFWSVSSLFFVAKKNIKSNESAVVTARSAY